MSDDQVCGTCEGACVVPNHVYERWDPCPECQDVCDWVRAPHKDSNGDAFVFVVLVGFAGGKEESPWSVHRDHDHARSMATAQEGRVLRVPYYYELPTPEFMKDKGKAKGKARK